MVGRDRLRVGHVEARPRRSSRPAARRRAPRGRRPGRATCSRAPPSASSSRASRRRSGPASRSVRLTWSDTKSDRGEELLERQERRAVAPPRPPAAARWTSWYRIVIPKPCARRATAWPIRPKPTMPIVAPWTSGPSSSSGPHVFQRAGADVAVALGERAGRRPSAAPRRGRRSSRSGRPACCRPGSPRARAGRDVDVVEADGEVRDDLELRPGARRGTRRRRGR